MRKHKIVLGTLLAAMSAMALHPLAAQPTTSIVVELHAFVDVDGVRSIDKKIVDKPFATMDACINFAVKLPSPPPVQTYGGHTVVKGYSCIAVKAPGMQI